MSPIRLAVHAHFYQPPRENPWTEEVPREPSAAPFHDWNQRIAAESYRPNAFARVVDDRGRVVDIVNNYELLSFDVGPTLLSWLATHEPAAYARVLQGDAKGGGGVAQAFFHVILPLASRRDVQTHVQWGLAEFMHRFGRQAEGIWLPETAVNDDVLSVLAEEGVSFTILAPGQAAAARPLDQGGEGGWTDVSGGSVDTSQPYRWRHPDGGDLGVDLVFYDGRLSHTIAFELSGMSSQGLLDRIEDTAAGRDGLVTLAADGETFGHHHRFGDRVMAYALAREAARRNIEVVTVAGYLRDVRPTQEVRVVESAWSCAHGVGRWKDDCGCSTGGGRGWNQRWRAPLRAALDVVRDAVDSAFDRCAPSVLVDPGGARDAYVQVILGVSTREEFSARHVCGDEVEAFTLLEAQRHQLAMYTSCGWFFNDLAGLETVQVLRYAARAMDCLAELGEAPPLERFLEVLGQASSNVPEEGDGRRIWARHVEPARVDAERVVAHLVLVELLEGRRGLRRLAAFDVEVRRHHHDERGALALCTGQVVLRHVRTGRRTEHVYAAVHLGGLEVLGITRDVDALADEDAFESVHRAFEDGASLTTLLRVLGAGFGTREFGLESGLPDAPEQILESAAQHLSERFATAYEQLVTDHRAVLRTLASAEYPLPSELRAPVELALARRLEAEVAAQAGSIDPGDYATAVAIAHEARADKVTLDTPAARATFERLVARSVDEAIADPARVGAALATLDLAAELGVHPSLERAQEAVYDAIVGGAADPGLEALGEALGLAPGRRDGTG